MRSCSRAEELRAEVTKGAGAHKDAAVAVAKHGAAAKLTAEQLKAMAEAEAQMSGAKQIADTQALIATYDRLASKGIPATIEAQKKLHDSVEATIKVYTDAGTAIPPKLLAIQNATQNAANGLDRWSSETAIATDAVSTYGRALEDELAPAQAEVYNNTMAQIDANEALIPTWRKIRDSIKEVPEMLDRVGEATEGVPEMLKRVGKEGAQSWGDGFKEIAKNFGSLMTDAIVNGNWQNAFTALGSQVGSLLGTKIGTSLATSIGGLLGETVGAILPGIGAMLGPLLDKVFGKLLKTEGKKVNDLRDAYVAAGGDRRPERAAVAAGLTLDAFLQADTVEEYEKAIAR